jgi:hypothetical protein
MNHGLLGFPQGGGNVVPTRRKKWWTYVHQTAVLPNMDSRVMGVAYFNGTGDDLFVLVNKSGAAATFHELQVSADPTQWGNYTTPLPNKDSMTGGLNYAGQSDNWMTPMIIVPPGFWYRSFAYSTTATISSWNEYRSAP